MSCVSLVQVHSSDKPRLWNMTKDIVIACALCGKLRTVLACDTLVHVRDYMCKSTITTILVFVPADCHGNSQR